MNILRSIAMMFSMFSILPMPRVKWESKNMGYILSFLPLSGLPIALALWGWLWLCNFLNIGTILFAMGVTLIPVFISGGIHMDGFCDTVDALSSHAEPERKREILKDPHTGAFAVIGVSVYLLLYFALSTELLRTSNTVAIIGSIHVLSRICGGFASAVLKPAGQNGLQKTFHDSIAKSTVAILFVWFIICVVILLLLSAIGGLLIICVAIVLFLLTWRLSSRKFGGMSGDLAGYLIELSSIIMLFAYILYEKMVVVL